MNLAKLIYDRPDDFEAVVRAMHLPENEFETWAKTNMDQVYYASGVCGIEFFRHEPTAIQEFHSLIQKQKPEILNKYNSCFKP